MRLGGRISAAIDILTAIEANHQPAKTALSDWARSNRFAGSSDRAAIGNLVYDCLRNRSSLAWLMEDDSPRHLALSALVHLWGEEASSLKDKLTDDKFAPAPITEAELSLLSAITLDKLITAPPAIAANIPTWLEASFHKTFGDGLLEEGRAMARRAPLDLRVNTLKADRQKLIKALKHYTAAETALSPHGLRISPTKGPARQPNIEAEAAHGKGWFEVQDEGSQIAALMSGASPGDQVLDYCAGAGGKTLALSAMMGNKGQVHAFDRDKGRLRPIFERLRRAGCRNVQTHEPGDRQSLQPLENAMDIVLVDAPCTGAGTWRRHPDAKWRLSEATLASRIKDQQQVLDEASCYVKPGGRLVYITCSLLQEENERQVTAFLNREAEFQPLPHAHFSSMMTRGEPLTSATGDDHTLTLTPGCHGTDGFFIALMQKKRSQ